MEPYRGSAPRNAGTGFLSDVMDAIADLGSRAFRAVLVKTLALTACGLVLLGVSLGKLVGSFVVMPHAVWLATTIHALTYLVIFVALTFCVTPASFAVAGFFFDHLAAAIETVLGDGRRMGRALPIARAAWVGCQFALLSVLVNAAALLVSFLPGVNAVVFFAANAYLLGRGFFEMAALRHLSPARVRELRRRHRGRIFLAGCCCAALATVPLLNLLTPLFATALLVRVTWRLEAED